MKDPQHTLIVGPVGTMATSWASRQASLPTQWLIESTFDRDYIHRVAGLPNPNEDIPPFRAPHHTVSAGAMRGHVKDGWKWQPGECSLAHGGVLFLDGVHEFRPDALAYVHQAIKDGCLLSNGTHHHLNMPTHFRLIAFAYSCPCGYRTTDTSPDQCRCDGLQIEKHLNRIPRWMREHCKLIMGHELE